MTVLPSAIPPYSVCSQLQSARVKSAAAERVHDLDHITVLQCMSGMLRARDDFTVDLHRHAALAQAFGLQQLMQGEGGLKLAGFAIELDIHGGIFAALWRDFICDAT